jgi:hypothetical protein
MQYDPPDSPYRRAADRMVAAHQLIKQHHYREALDILNTAIVIAPAYPLAYGLRAQVFDALGLYEQAEADRQRERQIAATDGYPVADVVDGVATITMRRVGGRGGAGAIARRERRRTTGQRIGSVVSPAIFGILMLIGVLAAGLGGVLLAIDSLDDDNGVTVFNPDDSPTPTAAAATETPSPTEEPTAEPTTDITGSPYSLSSLTESWEDVGLTVTVNGSADGFEGFDNAPTDVTTSGGGHFAVFIYDEASATASDWTIGDGITATAGRSHPLSQSIWYNANVIAVVLSDAPGAFDAFVNMVP